ncbi:TPA: transcriptional regulator [Salmonella enterica subsp. diarizonae serovar 61:r:-]
MNTLTVIVLPEKDAWEQMGAAFEQAMTGKHPASPFVFAFSSIEELARVMLAPNRLSIINTMAGAGAMTIRELSRRVQRDFKAVHRDVQTMLNAGVIELEEGKIIFPFDAVHFDFRLERNAA